MVLLSSINRENIEALTKENEEPLWLNEMREKAFSKYVSLPAEVSPLYTKYSNVNRHSPEHIHIPDRSIISEPYEELKDSIKELEHGNSILRIGSTINRMFMSDSLLKQ